MARRMGALIAAVAAAPYLFLFCLSLPGLAAGEPFGIDDLRDVAEFLVVGGVGMALFGVPVLLLAGLLAYWFESIGWHGRRHAMAAGALLGSGLGSLFLLQAVSLPWSYPAAGAMAGAVCGLVYRAIARRPRSRRSVAAAGFGAMAR